MIQPVSIDETEAAILGRIIEAQKGDLHPDAARAWLKLRLPDPDEARLKELSAKAKHALTPEEEALLESYLHVGRLLDLMRSKARVSLKSAA